MSGRVRPVLRYQAPSAARKRTGEVETLLGASGLSFPRGDRPTPQTNVSSSIAFKASYEIASARPQMPAETIFPPLNCGWRKRGWLHSFMTMNCLTAGKVSLSFRTNAANADGAVGAVANARARSG